MGRLLARAVVLCNVVAILTAFALAQSNRGELRLTVTDPSGLGMKASVRLLNGANQYDNTLATTDDGKLSVQRLSYGVYQLSIEQPGFAPVSESVEIRSSLPTELVINLKVAT